MCHVVLDGVQGPCLLSCGPPWDILPCRQLCHSLHGNLCSSPWSPPLPSFCTYLEVFRVASLTFFLTPLSLTASSLCLQYVIREVLPALLKGSALPSGGSVLDHPELALSDMGPTLGLFSRKSHLWCCPWLTKTLPCKCNS